MNIKKHFAKKFKNDYTKLASIVKFDKFLHKISKNIKLNKNKSTMEIPHGKSKL